MKKNNSGFSLIELIVVIAIMAILAGVAVPTYVAYISKAYDANVLTELDEIKTAAIAAGAEKGTTVETIVVDGSGNVSISFADGSDESDYTNFSTYAENYSSLATYLSKSSYSGSSITWTSANGWQ